MNQVRTSKSWHARVPFGSFCLHHLAYQKKVEPRILKLVTQSFCVFQVKGLLKEKKLEKLVDPDLENDYVEAEVEQLIQVALLCTQGSPMERPKMSDVVRMLEGDGLAERWEEWQKVEVRPEVELLPHSHSEWIMDSTYQLHAEILSGPR